VRVSIRPCPLSRVVAPVGIFFHGNALTRAYSSGWFFFRLSRHECGLVRGKLRRDPLRCGGCDTRGAG
jgi:hypothetical protein